MNIHNHLHAFQSAEHAPGQIGIRTVADALGYVPDWNWSWDNYKRMILALATEYGLKDHLEIGGGRDPLFTASELRANGFHVTVNDISRKELALLSPDFATLCCDIAAHDTAGIIGKEKFDFAYCRMVMEHVPDVARMWANVHDILTPGGVALSFFPTLFAPPFVANQLMPERLSRAVLHTLFPDRGDEGDNPKFPAYYRHCRGSESALVPMLTQIGFREVVVLPFYGYSYFWKIPGLKQIDAAFTKLARARDWRTFTSFAFVIVRK